MLNTKTTREWWVEKYGEEGASEKLEQFKSTISSVTRGEKNPMYGRHDHTHGLKDRAKRLIGKTYDEIYGVERATDIRRRNSLNHMGEKNAAYGKVYTNGGKSVKGYYKGVFFRSLLEYSFLKHLESINVDIKQDLAYEDMLIEYQLDGRKRTYRPDFHVLSQNTVYEVKPEYAVKQTINQLKVQAATEHLTSKGIHFRVVTEKDFPKITFEVARLDKDVQWIEKTLSYFKQRRITL